MILLLYMIIRKKERKKERKKRKKYNSLSLAGFTLKRTSLNLIYPKKFHSCTLRYILLLHTTYYIKVLMCTFLSISYKDVLIRVLLFSYFKVYFVCAVYGTQ